MIIMVPLSDTEILIGFAVAMEALTGFVFAEVVRLNFLTRWLTEKPQYRAAWILGAGTLLINLVNMLIPLAGGESVRTPTSDVSLLPAVLLYPAMCLAIWIGYLVGRRSLWSDGSGGPG